MLTRFASAVLALVLLLGAGPDDNPWRDPGFPTYQNGVMVAPGDIVVGPFRDGWRTYCCKVVKVFPERRVVAIQIKVNGVGFIFGVPFVGGADRAGIDEFVQVFPAFEPEA